MSVKLSKVTKNKTFEAVSHVYSTNPDYWVHKMSDKWKAFEEY